jgi:hypothetical protein
LKYGAWCVVSPVARLPRLLRLRCPTGEKTRLGRNSRREPAEAPCLAPFAGTPAIGAWLGAFTSPADTRIRAMIGVVVGVVDGVVSGRSQAPFDGNTVERFQAPPAGDRRDAGGSVTFHPPGSRVRGVELAP